MTFATVNMDNRFSDGTTIESWKLGVSPDPPSVFHARRFFEDRPEGCPPSQSE